MSWTVLATDGVGRTLSLESLVTFTLENGSR